MHFFRWLFICCSIALALIGCSSSSSTPETSEAPEISEVPDYHASVTGQLFFTAGLVIDSDTNDINAPFADNNDPARAQQLNSSNQVFGFTAANTDPDDYFKVWLNAGQNVRLNVLQADNTNDLDLFVIALDGGQPYALGASQNTDSLEETESINIHKSGNYLILVRAVTGASSYLLGLLSELDAKTHNSVGLFASGEAVVQYHAPRQALRSLTSNIQKPLPTKIILPQTRRLLANSAPSNQPWQAQLDTLQAIKELSQDPSIEYAEPNYIRHVFNIPNDPFFELQHALPQIDLPNAWNLSTGSASDMVVAVLDTGVFVNHEDLQGKLVDGYDFISDLASAADGDSIDNNPDDPGDNADIKQSTWHGTHVSGIVAANTNNSVGIAGVSWSAKVMPLRVMGQKGGSSLDIAQAIRYAAGLSNASGTVPSRRADIINMSFGSEGENQVERDAITAASQAGVLIVAASGNDGEQTIYYPAGYPQVIAVAATAPTGQHASYSNYGSHIKLAAPGGEILSDVDSSGGILSTFVDIDKGTQQRTSAYAYSAGTSMAAPHVAGVFALMKAVNPVITYQQITAGIERCLITQRRNNCSFDNKLGYGQINARYALEFAQDPETLLSNSALLRSTPDTIKLKYGARFELELKNPSDFDISQLQYRFEPAADWAQITQQPSGLAALDSTTISMQIDDSDLPPAVYDTNLVIDYLLN